jgi:uncharacterized integral membrane protein
MELYRTSHLITTLRILKTNKAIITASVIALILAIILSSFGYRAQAQATKTFTPADRFTIPTQTGAISFALNGSYTAATLEDGTWVFRDLTFDEPKIPYFDLSGIRSIGDLNISARDCNVTVWIYLNANYTYPITMISYYADGGSQTINLGLDNVRSTDSSEWSVIVGDNVFLAEGSGWTLLPDDSVVINPSSAGNVTVMHFDFNDPSVQQSLPFYMQHSILLLAGLVLAVTVAAAVLIRVRIKQKQHR